MAIHLPTELIYRTVDELRVSDPFTVQSMSLACKHFRIPCQQLLYERFQLTLIDGIRAVERLEGLSACSHLISSIRDLRLSFPSLIVGSNFTLARWVTVHGDLLNSILEAIFIDQVERFELLNWCDLFHSVESHTEEQKAVRDRLRATVGRISGGASLQMLRASYLPISALRGCGTSLKHLILERACPTDVRDEGLLQPDPFSGTKARLQSLEVHSTPSKDDFGDTMTGLHQYLLHPNGRFDLGELAHLSWMRTNFDDLDNIMRASERGLTSLELDLGYGFFGEIESPKLGPFHNLRHLSIHICGQFSFRTYEGLEWLSQELSDDGNRCHHALETVCFNANIGTAQEYGQLTQFAFGRAYRSIDATLANQQSFPELKEVEVYISAKPFSVKNADGARESDTIEGIERAIRAAMPGLNERSLLKVTIDLEAIDWRIDVEAWYYTHYD